MTRTARIAQLRESIARHILDTIGVPADARILHVYRVGQIFIVASEEPSNRWAAYSVGTFRIPTADTTDPLYEEGQAPKLWGVLAGWAGDGADEVDGMLAAATAYARSVA
ncbi:hypothetical protein [Streptomyces reniochalinae]|uniref:Uncharacterized protein n=1 Tax=Streptomyces reniochalinae TaxID=2250578 RepID=A0A367EUT0_9ACTN|nr:hypothetical protein [Streptomyces reniochalinae]RCG21761.1 hypothetical protein DQ392_08620 [Streptomyces reniochalinae]